MNRLAQWLERKLRIDRRYVVGGGFWLLTIQAASTLSSLALAVVFARYLSKPVLGEYKYIMAWAGIIEMVGLNGLATAVTRAVAQGREGSLSQAFRANLRLSYGIVLSALGFAAYYAYRGNLSYTLLFAAMALALPLLKSLSLATAYFFGKKNFRAASYFDVVSVLLINTGLIASSIVDSRLVVLGVVYFVGAIAVKSVAYWASLRAYPPKNDDVSEETVPYSLHLSLMGLVTVMADRADSLIVFYFLGPAALAVYTYAVGIPEHIKGAPKLMMNLLLPKLSEREPAKVSSTVFPRVWQSMGLMAMIAGAYILVAPLIFKVAFPQYESAILLSQAYAPSLVLVSGSLVTITALRAMAATRELYKVNLSSSIVLICLLVALTHEMGAWGAVLAIVLARAFRLGYSLYLLGRLRSVRGDILEPLASKI